MFNYVYVFLSVWICALSIVPTEVRGIRTGVIGGFELLDMNAGYWTLVLFKGRKISYPLSHLSKPFKTYFWKTANYKSQMHSIS